MVAAQEPGLGQDVQVEGQDGFFIWFRNAQNQAHLSFHGQDWERGSRARAACPSTTSSAKPLSKASLGSAWRQELVIALSCQQAARCLLAAGTAAAPVPAALGPATCLLDAAGVAEGCYLSHVS